MRLARIFATAALLVLVLVEPAQANHVIVIGRDQDHGTFAYAVAVASVDWPTTLWVKVKARPNQRVDVDWGATCSGESRGASFSARTPFKRKVTMPADDPSHCAFSAGADPRKTGRVTLVLLAQVFTPEEAITYSATNCTQPSEFSWEATVSMTSTRAYDSVYFTGDLSDSTGAVIAQGIGSVDNVQPGVTYVTAVTFFPSSPPVGAVTCTVALDDAFAF